MSKTNFSLTGGNRRAAFLASYLDPGTGATAGNVFFVDSVTGTNTSGNGRSPDGPFASINYAVTQCTANNGDVIFVLPGHTETVSTAGGLAFGVAGVKVVGLGHRNTRPTVDMTAAAATVTVTANDVWIENLRFEASFADITSGLVVTGKRLTLKGCHFDEPTTDENWVDIIDCSGTTTTAAADGLWIEDCRVTTLDTANDGFVEINATTDGLTLLRNYIRMGVANGEAVVAAGALPLTNVWVEGNRVFRLNTSGTLFIDTTSSSCTGLIASNFIGHADTDTEVPNDATGVRYFENRATAANDASGYLLPTVDS